MKATHPPLSIKVFGDYACFTRPEFHVERFTYPVMTPSAACGVLEAILWKPEFSWHVAEIAVLRAIQYYSLVRNEVNRVIGERDVRRAMAGTGGINVADRSVRELRHSTILRDVAYIIRAYIVLPEGNAVSPAKYPEMFRRRVERGQCHATPYLGCREFSAAFAPPSGDERPVPVTADLGRMLRDMSYDWMRFSARPRPTSTAASLTPPSPVR